MEKNKGLFSFRKHPVGDFPDGKKGRKRKGGRLRRSMGFLMAAVLIFNTLPASGLAVSASEQEKGLCEHHRSHTSDCGYREAQPCTHEHGEECYKTVTECAHEHTDECYPETEATEESTGEGSATDYGAEGREPENCTHVCSEESGCITKVLDCHHEHDENCGYQEAQDCGYVCEICNGTELEDTENNAENDAENAGTDTAECICETLCTEDSINGDCPVCGADDASFLDCKGKVPEENTENQEDTGICKHHQEHDADCGYIPKSEDGEGSPCTYVCRICPIEALIAALPEQVTEDNAEVVRARLDEILDLFTALDEDEQGQLDLSRVIDLQGALDAANAPIAVAGEINIGSSRENILTEEAGGCQGHTFTGTTAMQAKIYVASGVHDVTFSGLNITATAKVGVAPGATMNLTIDGTNTIQAGGNLAGIYVPVGATLIINGTGSLNVSGSGAGAGIGGAIYAPDDVSDGDPNCGTVVINGGIINATGGGSNSASAGIGGGSTGDAPGNGGTVTINGGTVTATGGSDNYYGGAGIGGAGGLYDPIFGGISSGCGGSLTINGGHVTLVPGQYDSQEDTAYGFGAGSGDVSGGTCELTLADASYLTADSLDPNGKYTIKSAPTADMISVPSDMHYTSADMAAEIKGKVTLAGKVAVCGRDFAVDTSGWTLDIAKVSDMEYTATYTHAGKGTISKTVTILPCIHNNGAALTHHDRVEADCTHTGILEYWNCSICGKNFSDKDGKTEITDTELPIAAHTLTHHDGVEADCMNAGVKEYWECSVCKKIFSDKDGQTEITDIIIPITDHTLTHHEGQEATCTAAGSREYWDCSVCGKKFSDQNGLTEIADADITISVKPHTLTRHAGKEAGCLTEGNIEYWSCSVCSKLFADADGKKEVTDIKIPAIGHDYGAWGSNGNGTHTHSCKTPNCGFTETENCSGGTATYTEEAICTVCGGKYGERLKDTGAPTGEISIRTNHWNSFLHTITFGLFFKETEQVTITAQDNESGVASVSYYISDSKLTEEEVKKLENWTAGNTDKTTFSISPDKSCVVYAKITDQQGNVTYISSDGLVFDGTSPSITGIADGETYCTSQEVTVTDNNSESVTVTVNGKEQTLSDSKFTLDVKFDTTPMIITATDKAGNTATVTVNAGHDYGTDWKSGSNGHWQECVVCGNKSEVLAHTEDSGTVTKPATQTETGIRTYKCSVCGYEMRTEIIEKLPESHTHSYGTEWKSDSNSHWHECDCGAKSDSGTHTEDSGTVTKPATETETGIRTYKCSVCGYKMRTEIIEKLPESHKHSYGTEWKSDSNNHWHECSCGEKSDSAAHTEDSGTVTKPATETETGIRTYKCSVCGYEMRTEIIEKLPESHKHSYGTEWKFDSNNHWHECDCGAKSDSAAHTEDSGTVTKPATQTETGIRTYKCSVCGYEIRTEIIEKLPESHKHSYGTEWKFDSNNHWHECSCGEKSGTAVHTWDSGTVTVQPTTDKEGEKTFTCTVCGKTKTETLGKLPPSHKHSYGTEWKSDNSNHWHECSCGEKSETAAHTWDSGTVTVQPTTDKEGEKTFTCTVCGKTKTETLGKLPPSHKHSYGTEWKSDNSNHWHECSCGEKSGTAAHTWDSGTVTVQPTTDKEGEKTFTCTVCGRTRTETLEKLPPSHTHNYGSEWKSDSTSHWHECSCGDKSDSAAHTEDSGTVTKPPTKTEKGVRTYKCSVCGYVMRTADIAKLPSDTGSGDNGNNDDNGDNGNNNNNNGDDGKKPGSDDNRPQPPVTPSTDPGTNPGNDTTPKNPDSQPPAKPGTTPGSGKDTPAQETKQPFIKDADGKIGWDVIRAEEEKAAEGNAINVNMNGSTVVPGDIFDSIKGKDITITFDMGNGIIWSVNGKSITTDKADDIDFSVKTGTNAIPVDIVNNITGERYSIQLSLSHEGEFGFTAILSINLGKDNAGLTANLYYYNESTGELEFIFADTVAEDGMVSLAFTHASDYVIVIGESEEKESSSVAEPAQQETPDKDGTGEKENLQTRQAWRPWWFIVVGALVIVMGIGLFFVVKKKKDSEDSK